jgi:Cation efflux family
VAEVIGGLITGSLALLADAGHMLSDNFSLGLALFAFWLSAKTRTWSSFSKTTLSGTRGRWQPSGWFTSLSGRRAANCSQMGSMMYGGTAGTDRLLRIGKLRELPE